MHIKYTCFIPFHFSGTILKQPPIDVHFCRLLLSAYFVSKKRWFCIMFCLSSNWTFSLPLMKSGSLNWSWSTNILGQFVTRMSKNWLWYWKLSFDVTDKKNNASRTCCDTSDNVCLHLQNCRYSIFIT